MLFQHTLDEILAGHKSQTRRITKSNELAIRGFCNKIEAVKIDGRIKWRVGKTYAVQPARGQGQVARIRLVAINSEKLSRISTNDARAEGFPDRQTFLKTWRKIHGDDSLEVRVWVLRFEVVDVNFNTEKFSSKLIVNTYGKQEPAAAGAN